MGKEARDYVRTLIFARYWHLEMGVYLIIRRLHNPWAPKTFEPFRSDCPFGLLPAVAVASLHCSRLAHVCVLYACRPGSRLAVLFIYLPGFRAPALYSQTLPDKLSIRQFRSHRHAS